MVAALRRHVRLLEDFGHRLFDEGNVDYAGEIAGKIRLLAAKFGSNVPLLIRLMRDTGIEVKVVLGGPEEGREVTLGEFMHLVAVAIRLPAGNLAELTKEDMVRGWAEQVGSCHEDWAMSESLSAVLSSDLYIGGHPAALVELRATCSTVLMTARRFLAEYDARTQRQ
jgi:hypothetical protein